MESVDDREERFEIPGTGVMTVTCPACHGETMTMMVMPYEIAYFGEVVQNIASCSSCGYRHTDMFISSQREPSRHQILVSGEDHMSARVVRSSSGTVRVPEMGVLIEPGPASDGYITNVEGMLERIRAAVNITLHSPESEEQHSRSLELLDQIESARRGDFSFTLIIDDPYGNSAIISDDAVRRPLSREECETLKTGEIIIDRGDADE